MKVALFIIKFLLLGSFFIISNHNLYMNDAGDRAEFFSISNIWLSSLFDNAKTLTSYVAKLEWMPIDEKLVLPLISSNSVLIDLPPK